MKHGIKLLLGVAIAIAAIAFAYATDLSDQIKPVPFRNFSEDEKICMPAVVADQVVYRSGYEFVRNVGNRFEYIHERTGNIAIYEVIPPMACLIAVGNPEYVEGEEGT